MLYAEYVTTINDYQQKPSIGETLPESLRGVVPTALCKEKIFLSPKNKNLSSKNFEEVIFCNLSVGTCVGNLKMLTKH